MAAKIPALATLTSDTLAALLAEGDALHVARLDQWQPDAATQAAASLANGEGGLIVVEGGALTDTELLHAGAGLQPHGTRLVRACTLDLQGKPVSVIAVRESADPPVLCGKDGVILERGAAGAQPVTPRAALDRLLEKGLRYRTRAEGVIDSQTERTAFGHLNFLTIALIVAPLIPGPASAAWAREHSGDLARTRLALGGGLTADALRSGSGLLELRHPGDESPFVTIAQNGTITAGMHRMRPALDHFVSAAELAGALRDMAQAARVVTGGGDAGFVQPALFVQGLRNLQLETVGGRGTPCKKDQQRVMLSRQFLESQEDEDVLIAGLLGAMGELFSADLASGVVPAYGGDVERSKPPKAWHGKTRRTERRVAFLRQHGS